MIIFSYVGKINEMIFTNRFHIERGAELFGERNWRRK